MYLNSGCSRDFWVQASPCWESRLFQEIIQHSSHATGTRNPCISNLWIKCHAAKSSCVIFLPQVKFASDTIDETDLLEETLKPRVESFGGKLEKVVLRGTHITPCTQVLVLTDGDYDLLLLCNWSNTLWSGAEVGSRGGVHASRCNCSRA